MAETLAGRSGKLRIGFRVSTPLAAIEYKEGSNSRLRDACDAEYQPDEKCPVPGDAKGLQRNNEGRFPDAQAANAHG